MFVLTRKDGSYTSSALITFVFDTCNNSSRVTTTAFPVKLDFFTVPKPVTITSSISRVSGCIRTTISLSNVVTATLFGCIPMKVTTR